MGEQQTAKALWIEYLRVPEWASNGDEAHAARCAIRCCAARLNVYAEFCALNLEISETQKEGGSLWKSIEIDPPESGVLFVLICADGSGSGYYLAADGGEFLGAEDGEPCTADSDFMAGGVWAEVPDGLVMPWFMTREEPRP